MGVIRNLIVRVGADVSGLSKGMKDAEKQIRTAQKGFEGIGKGIQTAVSAVTVAGGAIAAGLGGMATSAVQSADEIQRLSDVTGLSAERIQELKYAGSQLGVELETITGAQSKLTKAMFAAKDGTGTQAEAFKALGIAVVDGNGKLKDSKQIMTEAFNALNKVGNETERDALAMQLFGKSAMELNPLIKAGGDELARLAQAAEDTGGIMSGDKVAALDAFGDSLETLKLSFMGIAGSLAMNFLPAMQGVVDFFKGFAMDIGDAIKNGDWERVKNLVFEYLDTALRAVFETIFGMSKENAGRLAEIISGAFEWLIDNKGLIIGAIIAIGAAMAAWNTVVMIQGVIAAIKVWQTATQGMTIAQAALNFVMNANPIGIIITAVAAVTAAIIYLWNTNEGFRNALIGAWDAIKQAFINTFEWVKANWQGLVMLLVNPIAGALKLLYDNNPKFKAWADSMGEAIKTGLSNAINWIKALPFEALQWGKDIIMGIVYGINSAAKAVGDAVNGVAQNIRSFLHFSVPDEGPLVDYESWMPDFMKGLAKGIKSSKRFVMDEINNLSGGMTLNNSLNAIISDNESVAPSVTHNQNVYIQSVAQSPADIARATKKAQQELAFEMG